MRKIQEGTVIRGTMRNEDVIPALVEELEDIVGSDRTDAQRKLIYDARNIVDYDSDDAFEIGIELFDALNDLAPEGMYFGSHEGDGSDYGFWSSGTDYDEN